MIIACPSCSAKYQLADSKVKASGTKVRCPRCSHTFTVYREHTSDSEEYGADRTELFIRRDEALQKKVPPNEVTNARAKTPAEESFFDQKTSVSPPPAFPKEEAVPVINQTISPPPPAPEKVVEKKKVVAPPKQDPARIVTPSSVEDEEASEENTHPRQDSKLEDSDLSRELKPFGDATLFEIQRGFKKKASKRLVKVAGIVAGVAVLVLGLQQFLPKGNKAPQQVITEVDLPVEIARPAGWYKDDPQVYQDTLSQMAALPPQEQDKPENRALLAEALILSGLLTGATDQVITGMGFSSSLVVSHSLSPFGYYGIAAYAVWNEDRRTLQDLVERWPEAYRDEPEFALVEFVSAAVNRNWKVAFSRLKNLIHSEPDFQRANDFGLLFALRQPQAAQEFIDQELLEKMKATYLRHRSSLERELSQLPKIYTEIDQYLGDASERQQTRKESTKKSRTSPKAEVAIPPEKTFPENQNGTNSKKPKETAKKSAAPAKQSSRLPAPSANLIAQNKVSERQRQDAVKLFESGNELYKQGKADEALKAYRDALKLNPEYADIYKRIGMIYMSRQEPDRALRSFKIYLQLKPDSEDKQLVEGWISSLQ